MNERIKWIDWAKTICMFLVILGHCHLNNSWSFITIFIYSFHIPLFFFLSGLLCSGKFTYHNFKKDIKFILVPYFTYGIISISINCILSHNLTIHEISNNIFSLFIGTDCSIGPIWFLPALFICKQSFCFIHTYNKNNNIKYILLIVSFIPVYFIYNKEYNIPFFADSGICAIPFFCIGHYSSSINRIIKKFNRLFQFVILFSLMPFLLFSSLENGIISIADCVYGNNIILYYSNAIIGIIIIIIMSILLEKIALSLVTIMAYGTIVTLGFHGFILRILHYYIPIAFSYYNPVYPLYTALFYCIVVYSICYSLIVYIDKKNGASYFGLRGQLKNNRLLDDFRL